MLGVEPDLSLQGFPFLECPSFLSCVKNRETVEPRNRREPQNLQTESWMSFSCVLFCVSTMFTPYFHSGFYVGSSVTFGGALSRPPGQGGSVLSL